MRTFRVDRIERLAATDRTYQPPASFDIHGYLTQEQQAFKTHQVRLRILPEGADIARDYQHNWDEVVEQPDGSLFVTLSVPDLTWAASTVLAYGGLAIVEKPPELMALVRQWAQAIVEQHS